MNDFLKVDASEIKASYSNKFNAVQDEWKPTYEYSRNPWQYFKDAINILKKIDCNFITFSDAISKKFDPKKINIILDHHIDYYPVETEIMTKWESDNNVISSIYLFNRSDYEDTAQRKKWRVEDLNIPFYQNLEKKGFEIGYHQNALGSVRVNREGRTYSKEIDKRDYKKAKLIFAEDVYNLKNFFNIRTFIPHGGGEGNSLLTDIPANCKDLIWVYNGRKKNGLPELPVSWTNFSDSAGTAPQIIKSKGAKYIVRIDNLHMACRLAKNGLNHILIHPGRYGRGMPYETYSRHGGLADYFCVRKNFLLKDICALPIYPKEILENIKEESNPFWLNNSLKVYEKIPNINEKYYLYTDSIDFLVSNMMKNKYVIPQFVKHKDMTKEIRNTYKVPRPIDMNFYLPTTSQINNEFTDLFRNFFNIVYSENIISHLNNLKIKPDYICLKNLKFKKQSQINDLKKFINSLNKYNLFFLKIELNTKILPSENLDFLERNQKNYEFNLEDNFLKIKNLN